MLSMYEIYRHHSKEYDQLVDAEDYQGNLRRLLHQLVKWDGAAVVEAGTGTGRVTELYVKEARLVKCFDREPHMLEAAKRRLLTVTNKVTFQIGDNLQLPVDDIQADVFIEGWSWGHTVIDGSGTVEETTSALLKATAGCLHSRGTIIVIETMGTNVEEPSPPDDKLTQFYRLLVAEYGMHQEIIRTDYRFSTIEEADRIMGFFFGDRMRLAIQERNDTIAPEWTGVWKGTMGI